jgi:hypothetical protein
MDNGSKIKRSLKELVSTDPNYPIIAVVKSVEGEACTVELKSGLVVSDVRLKATVSESDDHFTITPALNSEVMILSTDGTLRSLTVIKVDKIAKLEFSQAGLTVLCDTADNKVNVQNQETSLKDIFAELANVCREFVVITPDGPSTAVSPITLTAINDFEILFNKLLK